MLNEHLEKDVGRRAAGRDDRMALLRARARPPI